METNEDASGPLSAELRSSDPPAVAPSFGAKRALKIFLVFFLVSLLVKAIVGLLVALVTAVPYIVRGGAVGLPTKELRSFTAALAGLIGPLCAGLVALGMTRRSLPGSIKSGSLSSIGWLRASGTDLAAAGILGVSLSLAWVIPVWLVGLFQPATNQAWGFFDSAAHSGGWPRHMWEVYVLLCAPPIEEFIYRGVLFSGLARSWGSAVSGVLVTIAFIVGHVMQVSGYWQLLPITAMGIVVLFLRIRVKSLGPPIICHCAYNSVVVLAIYWSAA